MDQTIVKEKMSIAFERYNQQNQQKRNNNERWPQYNLESFKPVYIS